MASRRSARGKEETTPKTSTKKVASRKRKEPGTSEQVEEEDIAVTSMSSRRKSGRERKNVKSALELLGLKPPNEIKKEKGDEDNPRIKVTKAHQKSSVSKDSKPTVSIAQPSKKQRVMKVKQGADNDTEASESPDPQASVSPKQASTSETDKPVTASVSNSDNNDSTTITIDVPVPFDSSEISEEVRSHLENYIVEKDSATGCFIKAASEEYQADEQHTQADEQHTQADEQHRQADEQHTQADEQYTQVEEQYTQAVKKTEENNQMEGETQTFDGLVDPETGLIIADNVKEQQIQIIEAEEGEGGEQAMYVTSEGNAVQLHSVANEAGEHQYFVFSSGDDIAKAEGTKVILDSADINLIQASQEAHAQGSSSVMLVGTSNMVTESPAELIPAPCSPTAPEPETLEHVVHMTKSDMNSVHMTKSDMNSVLRDRRLMNKSNFSNTPVTSEELMSAPVGKNGRCVPQRQVVVAPELQDLVTQLKENDTMENHIVSVGVEEGMRNKFACKHCGEDIPNRHFFRRHMNLVHKDLDYKPWKCPLCDYKAIIKASIARHINVHSDMKPYTCLECGKGFTFRQKLQIHMKYHNDQRDHRCALCEMAFHELKTLKTHLSKIHGIEKPKEFIDKYRGKPLTSVMIQLDDKAKPAQGFILPKESEQKANPPKEFANIDALKKHMASRAQTVAKQKPQMQRQVVEVRHQDQQMENIIEQEHYTTDSNQEGEAQEYHIMDLDQQQQTGDSSQQHREDAVEIQFAADDGRTEASETVQNLLDLGWQIQKAEGMNYEQQIVAAETEANQTIVKTEDGTEMSVTEVQMVPEEVVEAGTEDMDEVNVLLPRHRRSTTYGTRKTQLRTSRFRLGLEGNYTPIKSMQAEKEEDEDVEEDEEEMIQDDDTNCPAEGTKSPRRLNNQKIVSENQIEDELKKYCKVDTNNPISRIVFTCTLCPEEAEKDVGPASDGSGDHESGEPASEEPKMANTNPGTGSGDTGARSGERGEKHNQFFSKTRFCMHLEAAHPEVKPWICVTCGYKARMRSCLISHCKSHEPVKKYACTLCDKKYLFKQKLNVHMRSHQNLRLHECPHCDRRFNETTELSRHMKRVHSEFKQEHGCDKCSKSYHNAESLARHMESHDPSKKFLCHYCNNYYRSKGSLAQHMKSHTCMFHCEICSKNFGSYSGFMAHKVMHDQSFEGFECEICHKRLHTKGSFTRHKMVAHSNNRPFSCNQCAKSFKTKKDLKNHGAVHSSVRAFSCPECSFTCKRLESLKIHCRRHSAVKPFACPLACGKQYTQRSSLDAHLRHHTGGGGREGEANCKLCNKEFGSKYLLRRHIQSCHIWPGGVSQAADEATGAGLQVGAGGQYEEGVTVYMCEECSSVFLSQDDLAVHILAEHMHKQQAFSLATDAGTEIPNLTVSNEIPLDTGLPSSGLSEHSFDSQPPTIMDTETAEINDQMQYITVDNPGGGGSKVVSLVHPPTTQSLDLGQQSQLYLEDGKIQVVKQEEGENATMVTIADPSTNEDVVVPMATSTLDALLVGMAQSSVVVADYEQVAETVEVQD